METASKQADIIPSVHYSNMLLVTFLASAGFCFAILKVLPLNQDTGHAGWDDDARNFTNAIMRLCFSCVFFPVIVCAMWTIKNQKVLHRRQLIFWPTRCRHCARAVGLISPQSQSQCADDEEITQRHMSRRRSLPSVSSTCSTATKLNKSLLSNELTASTNEYNRLTSRGIDNASSNTQVRGENSALVHRSITSLKSDSQSKEYASKSLKYCVYKRRHRSLLILYNVFGTIAMLNIPVEIIGIVICLAVGHNSETPVRFSFNLVCEGIFDLLVAIGLGCNLVFFNKFYDAVFTESCFFSTYIGVYLASGLALLALKVVYPLGIVGQASHMFFSCKLPKTYDQLLRDHSLRITPLYTQIGLIGVSILWKIWTSITPQSNLRITDNDLAEFERFHKSRTVSIAECIKNPQRSLRKLAVMWRESFVCQIVLLSVILVAMYYSFDKLVVSRKSFGLSAHTRKYILWSFKMICFFPYIALYRYQLFLSGNSETFRLKYYISLPHGLIRSHDIVLILGCSGVFMINVFRLVATAGVLFSRDSIPKDELSLACFGLVYYTSQIYVVSSTTSFLLIIPRQKIGSKAELKFVLVCLMYIVCLNGIYLLTGVVDRSDWKELTMYFGPFVGTMIGRFVEPMIWLYFLHAAIVANESYRYKWDQNGISEYCTKCCLKDSLYRIPCPFSSTLHSIS